MLAAIIATTVYIYNPISPNNFKKISMHAKQKKRKNNQDISIEIELNINMNLLKSNFTRFIKAQNKSINLIYS